MDIMNAEVGSRIIVDGLNWIVLDFVTDSALCLLDDTLSDCAFGDVTWENSEVRKYLNSEFSKKLSINHIRNTPLDSKVFLLTRGQFLFYKNLIPEACDDWWLMPESGKCVAVTIANKCVSRRPKENCSIRPVVRYARGTQCTAIEEQCLVECGEQVTIGHTDLTVLEPYQNGFLCIFNRGVCLNQHDYFQEYLTELESEVRKRLKRLPERINFVQYALNGDIYTWDSEYVSLLDVDRYRKYRHMIPNYDDLGILSTRNYQNGNQLVVIDGIVTVCWCKGIPRRVPVRPIVVLPVEVIYANRDRYY